MGVPYTFANGTKADPSEVNSNFVYHDNQIAAIQADLAERGINIMVSPYNAVGDGVTDDTTKIQSAITAAKAANKALIIPNGTFLVSASLDLTGLYVIGFGKGSKIQASSAQFDVIVTEGDTVIENLYIHGGWDGATAGQTGHNIRIEKIGATAFISNIHIRNVWSQYAKEDSIYAHNLGYSSITATKSNASGRNALNLVGDSSALAITTISVDNSCTFSDCPNGFGVRIQEGVNITIKNVISENTKGFEIAGGDNRNIDFYDCYQEGTIGGKFITWTGSGLFVNIIGGFGGSSQIDYSSNFNYVNIFGLSNVAIPDAATAFNWGMIQDNNGDLYQSYLKTRLGIAAKNQSGGTPAHFVDTSAMSGFTNYMFEWRNAGTGGAGVDAAGGFHSYSGTWDGGHWRMGTYHIWVDGSGVLRIKNGVPTSATDGVSVGSQT